jgi:Tfp pilus assembly protein PilO
VTHRRVNILVVTLAVILSTAFAAGYLIPGMKKLSVCRAEILQRVQVVREEQRSVGNLSELYARNMEMNGRLCNYRHRLPKERQFGEFLKSLSDLLSEAGVTQSSVQQKPELRIDPHALPPHLESARGIGILPVQVNFTGNGEQVHGFFGAVESLPRIAHVESLKMVNDETSPGRVTVEMTIHTYYQPDDAAPAVEKAD